jgi:hypothetical protein
MQFDEMLVWLITAMGLTALAFFFWTLAAVVRTSRSTGLDLAESGTQVFRGSASTDRRSASS